MVRQFDVHAHPQKSRVAAYPFLVVVQHDRVATYSNEVLTIPLGRPLTPDGDRLMPLLELNGETLQLFTPLMLRVRIDNLLNRAGSLALDRNRIIAAIDLLFAGS